MGKNSWIVMIIETVFTVVGLAALFNSQVLSTADKIFFCSAFIVIIFEIRIHAIQSDKINERMSDVLFCAIRTIEAKLNGSDATVDEVAEAKLKNMEISEAVSGGVYLPFILITVADLVGMTICAYMLSKYVL